MSELSDILTACRAARGRGEAVALATVVDVSGSSYRRPGARMLFLPDGTTVGIVSGGCLEADLAERAREVLVSGRTGTLLYDMRSPDDIVWGLGLGCAGAIRILIERIEPDTTPFYLTFIGACLERRREGIVACVIDVEGSAATRVGERLVRDTSDGRLDGTLSDPALHAAAVTAIERQVREGRSATTTLTVAGGARIGLFLERIAPDVRLLVFGAGRDTVPLAEMAHRVGWRVEVFDPRVTDFERLEAQHLGIDTATVAVIMTHHFLHDLTLARWLLASEARYVGLLGPRRRAELILSELERRGFTATDAQLARFHAPLGLDLGAETPQEIAVAALAEIRAVLGGRPGGFLKHRAGPLHEGP